MIEPRTSFDLQYSISPEDLLDLPELPETRLRPKSSARIWRGLFGWMLLIGLVVLLFVLLKYASKAPPAPPSPPPPALHNPLIVATIVISLGITQLIIFRLFGAYWRRYLLAARRWARASVYQYRKTAQVDIIGLQISDRHSQIQLSWGAFVSFCETKRVFAMTTNSQTTEIVPKRAIGRASDINAFREMLHRNISNQTGGFPVTAISPSSDK